MPFSLHASVNGPAPIADHASRTFTPLFSCGLFRALTAIADANPAALPIAIAVVIEMMIVSTRKTR